MKDTGFEQIERGSSLHLRLLATGALCYKRLCLLDECLLHDLPKPRQRELIQLRIGHRHTGHVEDGGMRQDQVFDFFGADLFSPPVNHIFLAPLDDIVP